jgi:predicted amidohydrolase
LAKSRGGKIIMPGDTYPKFRAAAVQAAPVFLDRDATIDKLETLVQKAVDAGAELIVFGESFIPAFPVWNLIYAPMDQHAFFRRLFDNAVQLPGPHTKRLSEIAKRHRAILSVGITEKCSISMGTLWNTNLLFDRDGTLLNRHRKLVPTWAEKLTWANGDAAYLRPEETDIGRVGTSSAERIPIPWRGSRCLRKANKCILRPTPRHGPSTAPALASTTTISARRSAFARPPMRSKEKYSTSSRPARSTPMPLSNSRKRIPK